MTKFEPTYPPQRKVIRDEKGTTTMSKELADTLGPTPPPFNHDWGYQESKTLEQYRDEEQMQLATEKPSIYTTNPPMSPEDLRTYAYSQASQLAFKALESTSLALSYLELPNPQLTDRHAGVVKALDELVEDIRRMQNQNQAIT